MSKDKDEGIQVVIGASMDGSGSIQQFILHDSGEVYSNGVSHENRILAIAVLRDLADALDSGNKSKSTH